MKIILKQKKNIYKYILHLYITSNFEKGKKKRKEEEGGGEKQFTRTKTISLKNS